MVRVTHPDPAPATPATADAPASSPGLIRLAGAGAILFAVGAATANVLVLDPPAWDASGAQVGTWVHDHHTALVAAVAVFPLAMIALALFVAGLLRCAHRSPEPDASTLATVGAFGVVMIGAFFGTVEIARLVLLAFDGSTSAGAGVVELAYHLEAGAFALNLAAVGIALVGVAGAAVRSDLAPSWYWPVSLVGLVCGLAAAVQAPAMVNGASGWQIGFVTFVAWLVLLVVVGTRMIRRA
jgi:hypothetical protein